MIFSNDPEAIKSFLEDTSNIRNGATDGVFFPETIAETATLLRNATANGHRFTIAGNGTGTTGGRIPMGGMVISMQKLDHCSDIVEHAPGRASITVQAGVRLETVQQTAEKSGWLYPPDPTEKLCFIGSTIANNSSGARTYRYGATRNHVQRIVIVLPQGDILDLKRGTIMADAAGMFHLNLPIAGELHFARPDYTMPATSKHNAGYHTAPGMDLIDLFIGSEGTLGIIVEAELSLIPLPESIIATLIHFRTVDALFECINALRHHQTPLTTRAIEFFDRNALDFLKHKHPDIPAESQGALFIELETTAERQDQEIDTLLELMETTNAMTEEAWLALDRTGLDRMRDFRHDLPVIVSEWLSKQQESKISADMAVPANRFRELFDHYRTACEAHNFIYIIFGHIGNDHVHLNILPKNHQEFIEAKQLYRHFVSKAIELGGTLSAEHGIGKLKSEYLSAMYSDQEIGEMVRVKKILDPFLVLNVGNLIAERYFQGDPQGETN